MNRAREERGGILVMAAVMIPVFLLLTALVVDVGNWYTHKRQLQNRADAGAFAAGVEYAKNWKACVQNTNLALKASTAQEIADKARQFAADPEGADYAGGVLPSNLYNTEIANQAKLDVVINSNDPNYTDDTDYSDGGVGNPGNPCYLHTSGDDVSAASGQWTDVRVKERDLPSLFRTLGLPLARNGARARVEIRPALSGHRFLPLAVPNNVIEKVQVRYYKECGSGAPVLLETRNLYPLPAAAQSAFASAGGGTLWGLEVGNTGVGGNLAFNLNMPSYDPACGDYVPVGVEVRLASTNIDLNLSCAALIAARYADCFHRLSQIRVWNDGNADSQPRVPQVTLTGGCGSPGDGYFGTLPVAANDCRYGATVQVNWGTRNTGTTNVVGNFTVSANGVNLPNVSWVPGGVSTYSSASNAIIATNPGADPVTISLSWTDTDNTHSWQGNQCRNGGQNPCKYSGTDGHRTFVGTTGTAGAVALVSTSASPFVSGLPVSPFDNHRSGGGTGDCSGTDMCTIYPTVGTRTVLKAGAYTVLRLDDPQANQTLRCDPNYAQGQEFSAFQFGCEPWYGVNPFTNGTPPWWNTTTKLCPDDGQWFSYADQGAGFGVNSNVNPWRCVLTAPGMSTGQVGDDIAVATKNCNNINNNSCQSFGCNYDGNYDGKGVVPGWVVNGDSRYPRVVNLFIVPYQGAKGLTGAGDEIPVLGFASFYVMDWTGANASQSDPCPDRTWGNVNMPAPPKGAIAGVFVESVDYEPGPVDPNATCVEGQLTPCRVTLVR